MGRVRVRVRLTPLFDEIRFMTRFDPGPILPVQEGYAAWASLYDHDGNPLTALEGPVVRSYLGSIAGRLVLDLGCGTGRHTAAILDAGASAIALDLTPEMLHLARARLAGRPAHFLRHGFPTPLPFRGETFELVVLGLVAEHVESLAPAIAEVARVLNPGGRCILSALHPERTAEGQTARFIDPVTGLRRRIQTFHRSEADYLAAAESVGLVVDALTTLVVPSALADEFPRAAPYIGQNLGWVACWSKPRA